MYRVAGQERNVKKLCRKDNITNHEEDHSGFCLGSLLYLPLFFSFWVCLWWCQMLTLCDLRQPVPYFQWSAVPGCLLQLFFWSLCTQQSGLSTIGPAESLLGWRILFSPQAAAAPRGMVCLSTMAAAVWGMSQHWDPGVYSLSSRPKLQSLVSLLASPVHSAPCLCQSPG